MEIIDYLNIHDAFLKCHGSMPRHPSNFGPVDFKETPDLYNNSYIVLAENNIHNVNLYFTPRNLGGMAAGSCTLHRWFPGAEGLFPEYLLYRDKYDLLEKIIFMRNNPTERDKAAENGPAIARRFDYENWVLSFLKDVKA